MAAPPADMVGPEHSLHRLLYKALVLDAAVGFVVDYWETYAPGLFMTLTDIP